MKVAPHSRNYPKMKNFNSEIYKKFNSDLDHLNDDELITHYIHNQHEARIYGYTNSTVELFSMRWLRGRGLEIGPGRNPTPLFGNAIVQYCDIDPEHSFGGSNSEIIASIDSESFTNVFREKFDFIVASHVLEHTDSLIMAISNLVESVKNNGVIYLVVPDIEFLHDKNWLPYFDMNHHIEEYESPLKYANVHDNLYINTVIDYINNSNNAHASLSDEYIKSIQNRALPQKMRFMHHKHNYTFENWVIIIMEIQKFLCNKFSIKDLAYGHLRKDVHIILSRNKIE
jgi:SAM-dependent methyltransferase